MFFLFWLVEYTNYFIGAKCKPQQDNEFWWNFRSNVAFMWWLCQFTSSNLSILIFGNLLRTLHSLKKGDNQLIKNYRLISLHPICCKILETIIFNELYLYLHTNNQISKYPQLTNYYILSMKFINISIALNHWKLEQYFSVWHEGLVLLE